MVQRMIVALLAGALIAAVSCAKPQEGPRRLEAGEAVPIGQVPAPARETIQRETQGARLEGINLLHEEGKVVYVVEAAAGGKTLWFQIDPAGKVLDRSTAEDLKLDQLPDGVRATVERELKGGKIGRLCRGTRGRRTFYEAELLVGGKEVDLTVGASGKIFEKHVVEPK